MSKRKVDRSREKGEDIEKPLAWPYYLFYAATFVCLGISILTLFPAAGFEKNALWLNSLFLVMAAMGIILALSRQLPWQNVLLVVSVIALLGSGVHALGVSFGMPFGPFIYNDNAGPKIGGVLPWLIPFLWVALVLTARGVARLILRPWRKARVYGFRLMGMTIALCMLLDLALDPFCTYTLHLWLWTKTKVPLTWHDAPLVNFLSVGAVALFMLAFTTPSLIRKQPGQKSGPEYFPLIIWEGLMIWFGIGAVLAGLWTALALDAIVGLAVLFFSIRGARW